MPVGSSPGSTPPVRSPPDEVRGEIVTLGREIDGAYMARLETLVLDPALVRAQRDLRIVYTPIHGTGAVIIKPMLERLGFQLRCRGRTGSLRWSFPDR